MRSINLRTGVIMIAFALLPTTSLSQTIAPAVPSTPPTATVSPTPFPDASARPLPTVLPTAPVPSTIPYTDAPMTLSPTATPMPQAATPPAPPIATASPYHYTFAPPVPTVDAPRIIEIDLTDRVIRSGPMYLRVFADSTVTSVEVRAMGRTIVVPRIGEGLFAAESVVPEIPFFVRGRVIWVDFVAARSDGHSTVVSLPVTLS